MIRRECTNSDIAAKITKEQHPGFQGRPPANVLELAGPDDD
jgi:hypothetical protein